MTFGAWTVVVRILMEKVLFGGKIREDQKIRENTWKILFFQKTKEAIRGLEMGHRGPTPPPGAGHPRSRHQVVWWPWPTYGSPL